MNLNERFNISTPEEQEISSNSILEFIDNIEANNLEVHSLMLLRHGYKVAEGWWKPYSREHRHSLFSLSKAFTSTAIGLAIAEKLISIDDKVMSFFPDDLPEIVTGSLKAMKIKHLLTMTSGHEEIKFCSNFRPRNDNWVQAFLAEPVKYEPGTHFYYNNSASYLLSAIIQRVTGMTLFEYIEPLILQPLGIVGATWDKCPHGVNNGATGLRMKTEDIASFGQMYLNKGMWKGIRVVPEAWIDAATSLQVSIGEGAINDWHLGYGYQLWCCTHDSYGAIGSFGQLCIVMPKQDAVLVLTSAVKDISSVMSLVWTHLYDNMKNEAIPDNKSAYDNLQNRLENLSLKNLPVSASSPIIEQINGAVYVPTIEFSNKDFEGEKVMKLDIDSLSILFEDEKCLISYWENGGRSDITCGLNEPTKTIGKLDMSKEAAISIGTWIDNYTFFMNYRYIETPFNERTTCNFVDDKIIIEKLICVGDSTVEEYVFEGVIDIKEYY